MYADILGADVELPQGSMHVVSRNDGSIDIELTQLWFSDESAQMLSIHYHHPSGDNYSTTCDRHYDVPPSETILFSAMCVEGVAEVAVFVYVGDATNPTLSECETCSVPDNGTHDVVAYYFEFSCDPNICDSSSPTSTPTDVPTEAPVSCPGDVELYHQNGGSPLFDDDYPIEILAQNGMTVTFRVRQTLTNGTLDNLYTEYHDDNFGGLECIHNQNIGGGESFEYTAFCLHSVPISMVNIFVTDDSFTSIGGDVEIPQCCHPTSDDPNEKIHYSFKLKCVTECIPSSAPTLPPHPGIYRKLRGL